MDIFKKRIVRNTSWSIGGKLLAQVLMPLFAVFIARLLDPVDFGLFAIVAAIIGAVDVIKDLGISQAVIIERDERDLISMQFTVQLIIGAIVYCLILALSGHIALYFGNPKLKIALAVYSLMIFIYCVEYPLETLYMKQNKYDVLFFRQILPVIFYGLITYLMALRGFGVFALIIGQLCSRTMTVCFLLVKSGWKPKLCFDAKMFLRLFGTGKHILTQSICGYLVTQADSLIIGKLLGVFKLGFYRTANVITYLLPNAVLSQTRQVVFSDIAQRKDDSGYSSLRYYQFFRIIGAVSFVLSITIYFLSGFFITVVMGSKWEQVIPLVKVFAASLPTGMAVAINYDYSKILGFSHVYTVLTVIRAAATLAVLFICSLFSLGLTVVCLVVVSILDNAVCEVLFFKNQNTVRYNVSKLVFHLAAWVWAAYVITASHMRF